jgi:hypothetical protein
MALTKITSTVVSDAAITADKLGDGSITTVKIATKAITADKLANDANTAIIQANVDIVQDNVAALVSTINTTNDNVNVITDSTTDLDIGTGKYYFDKSETALGIANTNPAITQTAWGTPANVIIYYNAVTGGNVLVGATSNVTPYRFDVRGTANTGILRATQIGIGGAPSRPLTIESGENEQIRLINTHDGGDVKIEYRNQFGTDTNWFGGLEESDGSFRINFKEDSISSGEDTYLAIKKTMQVGIGTASPDANLHVIGTGHITGQVNMDDDLVVTGNLTVLGDTTTVNTNTLVIQDNFMALANSQPFGSVTSLDSGIFFNRGSSGNAALYYDTSAKGFAVSETRDSFSNTTIHPTGAANLVVGGLTTSALTIGATAVTSTAAELNILDGVTATATEINGLDGLTASRAMVTNGSGITAVSAVTATELGYLDGVGSAIQTQIDSKGSDSNVYATYIRLNANLNITNDNVAAVSGTNLAPGTNVITSVAGANAYGMGAAVTAISRTRVTLDGVLQTPTTSYVIPSSGVMQLTEVQTNIPAGLPIVIQRWT